MSFLGYAFYRILTFKFSLIPFGLLYRISDFLTFMLYRVVRYRRKVVVDQLKKCFPEKTDGEINRLAHESYRNLSDIILESFKTASLSPEEMARRYYMPNPELIDRLADTTKGIIAIGSHCNNWEWGSVAMARAVDPEVIGLYKPIANPYIDRYIKKIRQDAGTTMVPIKETRKLFESHPNKATVYVFVADQSPSNMREAIWLDFFGNDTACLHGPEKYYDQTGYPVVYLHVYRIKRGFYELKVGRVIPEKNESLTRTFMSLLEQDIRMQPANWLWTHKRWKRRREEAEEQAAKRMSL